MEQWGGSFALEMEEKKMQQYATEEKKGEVLVDDEGAATWQEALHDHHHRIKLTGQSQFDNHDKTEIPHTFEMVLSCRYVSNHLSLKFS